MNKISSKQGSTPGERLLPSVSCEDAAAQFDSIDMDIVQQATGFVVTGTTPIDGWGMSNKVVIVSTDTDRLVLRTNVPEHFYRYRREAWCLDRADEAGIPVPRVISCGVVHDRSYSIARYIEGSTTIKDRHDQLRVLNVLGGYAFKLNSIPVRGFGSEMLSEGSFGSTWSEVMGSELSIVYRDNYWEDSGSLSPRQCSRLRTALEECIEISALSGICHWDMGTGNARIRNEDYNDIILLDLEFIVAAPVPHYQLACMAKSLGLFSPEMMAFVSGYGISDDSFAEILPALKRLVALSFMRSVRWAQDRDPTQVQPRTADACAVISQLLGDVI